jgi:hypothetical protein
MPNRFEPLHSWQILEALTRMQSVTLIPEWQYTLSSITSPDLHDIGAQAVGAAWFSVTVHEGKM